jgi:hypothetical protein
VAVHCPECGFLNGEGANFCQRCGTALISQTRVHQPGEPTTATYRVGETGELIPVDVESLATHGHAAVVIRSGGNRVGESFPLEGDRMTVGRRPDSDVFLDDVTVSRDHALVVKRGGDFYLDDLGSLNGTYVNRRRIESHKLADGDELQVGKYKLTFLQR